MEYTNDLINCKTNIPENDNSNDIINPSGVKNEDSTINTDLPIYIKVKDENLTMNMEYIYDLINTTDKTKTYIMETEYSMIIIKSLGIRIEHSSVNIDFSEDELKNNTYQLISYKKYIFLSSLNIFKLIFLFVY